ncbi:MAG: NAD(P)/FAD-dependent oxidoreductase [Acidobacteria bacterium]|nr:NAD(P)/FAD-dependent oxidoreductase [Acidobacteriota bacterium]
MHGNEQYDVLIAGGGPAGMSCAIWCEKLGLRALIVEKRAEMGGQLLRVYGEITDYAGLSARDGRDLRDRIESGLSVDRVYRSEIKEIDKHLRVQTTEGDRLAASVIVIATGVRRRKLGVAGEETFEGKGVLGSGVQSRDLVAGKRVAIIGGGDAALENAAILCKTAAHVAVVHRRSEFSAREEFVKAAEAAENVEFLMDATVWEIVGNQEVTGIRVKRNSPAVSSVLDVDFVLVRIGVEPNSGAFRSIVDVDDAGYIRVNGRCETNVRGIYAIGDAADTRSPTIATAVGTGAIAAKNIFEYLKGRSA